MQSASSSRSGSPRIRSTAVLAEVEDERAGAVATFLGTVRRESRGRGVIRLEYEAYEGMAEEVMAEIAAQLAQKYDLCSVAIMRRVGVCEVGRRQCRGRSLGSPSPGRARSLPGGDRYSQERRAALEEGVRRGRRGVDREGFVGLASGVPRRPGLRGAEPKCSLDGQCNEKAPLVVGVLSMPNQFAGGSDKKSNFFATLPGILTGSAALITASATLAGVLLTRGGDDGSSTAAVSSISTGSISTGATSTESPPPNGNEMRIAFASDRDQNPEIYSMNAHGGAVRRLTDYSGEDTKPAWSPNGDLILFDRDRDGNHEIYVINASGGALRRLTKNQAVDTRPTWSPDGTRIAFKSARDGDDEIFVMNADGSEKHALTRNEWNDEAPAWSPDGSKIAFESDRDGDKEISVMSSDGGPATQLTFNSVVDQWPAWSPDGSKIAFQSARNSETQIFVMSSDGGAATQLTFGPGANRHPSWSPARLIAFESERDGNAQIYVMSEDGGNQHPLTTSEAQDRLPSWGPAP